MGRRVALLACCLAIGCGDDAAQPDAAIDAPPETGDSGLCGSTGVLFTGEYIDFESTASAFQGIFDATFAVQGDATRSDQTSPNGRWELCISNDPMVMVDVTPKSPYIGGTVVVLKDVIGSNGTFSLRSFSQTRGQMAPFNYDPAKAQLYVHVVGQSREVTISTAHDPGLHFTGTGWVGGPTGNDVYLPNLDTNGGSTKMTIANASMISTIPLAAGKFTYVVVVAH